MGTRVEDIGELITKLEELDATYKGIYQDSASVLALVKTLHSFNITVTDWNKLVTYAANNGSVLEALIELMPELIDAIDRSNDHYTKEETNALLPQKKSIGTFSTSDFAKVSDTDYYQQTVDLSGYIEDSDMLIITWAGSSILCPVLSSGTKGHVVGSLLNSSYNYQVVRVGYTLLDNNTKLKIELSSGYTPLVGYAGAVICFKL